MSGMENLLALGIGIGLASVAGVRAFVPLALAALFAALGLFEPPIRYADPGGWWTVVGVLVGGAVIAGAVAVAKVPLRPPAKAASAGVSSTTVSLFEDAVALVGAAVG